MFGLVFLSIWVSLWPPLTVCPFTFPDVHLIQHSFSASSLSLLLNSSQVTMRPLEAVEEVVENSVIYIKKQNWGTAISKLRQCSRVSQCYWSSIFKYFSSFLNPGGTPTLVFSLISFSVSKTEWDQLPHVALFSFSQWDRTNWACREDPSAIGGDAISFFFFFVFLGTYKRISLYVPSAFLVGRTDFLWETSILLISYQ